MSPLVPCPHCARHVFAAEPACPFCAGSLEGVTARVVTALPVHRRNLTRAAVVLMGATALAGCGKEPVPPTPADDGNMAAAYGAPPMPPAPIPVSTPVDAGTPLDAGKPFDAGKPKK